MIILPDNFCELEYAVAWLRGMAASKHLPDELCASSRDGAILTLNQAVVDGKLAPFFVFPGGEIASAGEWAFWRTDDGLDVFKTGRYRLAPDGVSFERTESGKSRGREAVALLVFQKENLLRAFGFEEVDPSDPASFRITSFPQDAPLPPRAKQMILYRDGSGGGGRQTADLESIAPTDPAPPNATQVEDSDPTASVPRNPGSAVVGPCPAAPAGLVTRTERQTRYEAEQRTNVVPSLPALVDPPAATGASVEQMSEDGRTKTAPPTRLARRKNRRGARARYDWAPIITDLGAKLSADGLPISGDGQQAVLEGWVAEQFPEEYQPSESVIRAKVAEVIKAHRVALGEPPTSK